MEELFSGKFGVEVMEALEALKKNREKERNGFKNDVTIKRKEIGMFKAESDFYEAMACRFPEELRYSQEHKKSNELWSQSKLDEECRNRIYILDLEIEEIDKLIARHKEEIKE